MSRVQEFPYATTRFRKWKWWNIVIRHSVTLLRHCFIKIFQISNFSHYSNYSLYFTSLYHVYRNSTWQNAKPGHRLKVEWETNKLSKSIDPYGYVIKIKHQFFDNWLTVDIFQDDYHAIVTSLWKKVDWLLDI